jgi:NAD(P)-dependent dehydrogenase (short-subunit alcohol dehydrogenase family)
VKEGRVIIVTGASSGIGRALAERAARSGFRVMAVGRRSERLEELKRVCAASTGSIETIAIDLRTPGAPALIVRETLSRYGRLDILVNNAGGVAVGPILEQSDGALREQFETHVFANHSASCAAIAAKCSSWAAAWRACRSPGSAPIPPPKPPCATWRASCAWKYAATASPSPTSTPAPSPASS